MAQKAKKKSKLRHAEYYDMQKTFDSLYADSKSGEVFGHLMDIISAPNNIKLAFRNIKGNEMCIRDRGNRLLVLPVPDEPPTEKPRTKPPAEYDR